MILTCSKCGAEIKNQIRKQILKISYLAGACHIGSALSCVEIIEAVHNVKHDAFLFAKASGVATYYRKIFTFGDFIPVSIVSFYLRNYPLPSKEAGCIWSGGSLGMGLSVAAGLAIGGKKTFCLISDGELDEGNTWEAILFLGHHRPDLKLLIDRNSFQALGLTEDILKLEPLAAKFKAFNWPVKEVDGHNIKAIERELRKPGLMAIICKTIKGKGYEFENKVESHYRNLTAEGFKKGLLQFNG